MIMYFCHFWYFVIAARTIFEKFIELSCLCINKGSHVAMILFVYFFFAVGGGGQIILNTIFIVLLISD